MWTKEELEELRQHAEDVMKKDPDAGLALQRAYSGLSSTWNDDPDAATGFNCIRFEDTLGEDFDYDDHTAIYALTDDQIKKLSPTECDEIEFSLDYSDPFMDKVYARKREIAMLKSFEYTAGKFTVGELRELIKDLDSDDIVEIYDEYNETSYDPRNTTVPAIKDLNGHKRLVFVIDTD